MRRATHFGKRPELCRDRPPLGPITLTITSQEAGGMICFPELGLSLPYFGWQLDNQDQALRRTLAWCGGRR